MGKSSTHKQKHIVIADHPHERGEKFAGAFNAPGTNGSSPRAWGKALRGLTQDGDPRIIPTSVGKRDCETNPFKRGADHPHERGEKGYAVVDTNRVYGSSPRAWGKEGCDAPGYDARRIIPTSVGKRRYDRADLARFADHPHERGEKIQPAPKRKA